MKFTNVPETHPEAEYKYATLLEVQLVLHLTMSLLCALESIEKEVLQLEISCRLR